jgi:hypothetical protein
MRLPIWEVKRLGDPLNGPEALGMVRKRSHPCKANSLHVGTGSEQEIGEKKQTSGSLWQADDNPTRIT